MKAPEGHPSCENGGNNTKRNQWSLVRAWCSRPPRREGEVVVFCLKRRKRAWPGFCISLGFMMEQQGCPARQAPEWCSWARSWVMLEMPSSTEDREPSLGQLASPRVRASNRLYFKKSKECLERTNWLFEAQGPGRAADCVPLSDRVGSDKCGEIHGVPGADQAGTQ